MERGYRANSVCLVWALAFGLTGVVLVARLASCIRSCRRCLRLRSLLHLGMIWSRLLCFSPQVNLRTEYGSDCVAGQIIMANVSNMAQSFELFGSLMHLDRIFNIIFGRGASMVQDLDRPFEVPNRGATVAIESDLMGSWCILC